MQHNFYTKSFFLWKGRKMYIVILLIVTMVSSFLTLLLHRCVIVGKAGDIKWEEEQITKKENKGE